MSDRMLFVRPDQWWSRGATVTGTIDTDYFLQWLVDGRLGYPVRSTDTSLSLDLAGPAGDVGIVVVGNHNVAVPIAISGDVSASVVPASTRPPNGIQLNPFALIDPVETGVTDVSVNVSGNDQDVVIGEVVLAPVHELIPLKIDDNNFTHNDYSREVAGEFKSVIPYDFGITGRRLTGSQYYTTTQRDEIIAWFESQRSGTYPSIIIPDPDINDAWFVKFRGLTYKQVMPAVSSGSPVASEALWLVNFDFEEYPRSRW